MDGIQFQWFIHMLVTISFMFIFFSISVRQWSAGPVFLEITHYLAETFVNSTPDTLSSYDFLSPKACK